MIYWANGVLYEHITVEMSQNYANSNRNGVKHHRIIKSIDQNSLNQKLQFERYIFIISASFSKVKYLSVHRFHVKLFHQ